MKIYEDTYHQVHNDQPITLTIGNFDGVHLGHQKLIENVKLNHDTASAVMTFDPHPATFLRKKPFFTLTNNEDKINILKSYNIDYFFIIKFDQETQMLSAEGFINFLKRICVKRLILGRDFRFGIKGSGTTEDLKKHFEVHVVDDILYNHMRISTTYIKDMLDEGQLGTVRKLLTRHYMIKGNVVHGNHVGRTLGFPTANIDFNHYYLPKNGVYFVKVFVLDQWWDGMANIGNNPTLNFSFEKRLEIYILDFNHPIYMHAVKVKFYHYLRQEIKFDSKQALIEQLKKDEATIRKLTLS